MERAFFILYILAPEQRRIFFADFFALFQKSDPADEAAFLKLNQEWRYLRQHEKAVAVP